MLQLLQDNFIFGEASFSHFFRVTTWTQQLHFWTRYFFGAAAVFLFFSEQPLFAAVIFSEELLFQNESSTEQPLLEKEKFFMAAIFRNSCFSLFRIKLLKNNFFFKAVTSA